MDTEELEELDTQEDLLPEEEIVDPELEAVLAGARKKSKLRIRAEWVMGFIALMAAVLLGFTAFVAFQSYEPEVPGVTLPPQLDEEDPLLYAHQAEPTEETEPEGTEIPTIPPASNPYDQFDFQYGRHNYLKLQNLPSFAGVDVSAYQGDINWKKVAASGIDFAMIRLGYRGWGSEGKLKEDEYARQNLEGAKAAGLRVGAYFFSQAVNEDEAREEARFVLELLAGETLGLPVYYDWERVESAPARTSEVDGDTVTACAKAFCETVEAGGYEAGVYFNQNYVYTLIDLAQLLDYPLWMAQYQTAPDFFYHFTCWQYTDSGTVAGISGPVDLDIRFLEKTE